MAQMTPDESSQDGNQLSVHSRPACDSCRVRKTKCDRQDPCSVCVVAKLPCSFTRRPPQKRQRVLLSARYEDALESIDRRLSELSESVDAIVNRDDQPRLSHLQPLTERASIAGSSSCVDNTHAKARTPCFDGFQGDSSLHSHVRDLDRFVRSGHENSGGGLQLAPVQSLPLHWPGGRRNPNDPVLSQDLLQVNYPELNALPLPPIEPVTRLLRLVNRKPQRLFTDVPVFEAEDLIEMCQTVYLAAYAYPVHHWIVVNVGLLDLFTNLDPAHYDELGLSSDEVTGVISLLERNCVAAIANLRLRVTPSIVACQAMSLLVNFCMKMGDISTAWRLLSVVARLLLDMGYHRLPHDSPRKHTSLFWHVYAMDKYMSFTLGRTPTIYHYDITTARPSMNGDSPVHRSGVGHAFIDFAYLAGQIHLQLFSASAIQAPLQTRVDNAHNLASQLSSQLEILQTLSPQDPTSVNASEALLITAYSYLTITFRTIPSDQLSASILPNSDNVADTARKSLESLVALGTKVYATGTRRWARFLNLLLTVSPFVPFLVVACDAISRLSRDYLQLLQTVIGLIEPIIEMSPVAREVHLVCIAFYGLADDMTSQRDLPNSSIVDADKAAEAVYERFKDRMSSSMSGLSLAP